MRSRSGDAPETMVQKLVAAHAVKDARGDLIDVAIDQIVLARQPNHVLGHASTAGLVRSAVEVALAYPPQCLTIEPADADPRAPWAAPRQAVALGVSVAKPGAGFAAAIHLERFAGPSRLALTDEPRLCSLGGIGMLVLPASTGQLSDALITGQATLRRPVSVQVHLAGRLRPFVSARDAALELLRGALTEIVERVDRQTRAPVVLEFGGSGARFLSVMERAVLCAIAPRVGAAGAVFASDDKTEAFLREQRRSKAHRSGQPDTGAPWEDSFSLELPAIEPSVLDGTGRVRTVRELAGRPVRQALLGGETGAHLRDLLAAATILKGKRTPPRVDFLLCAPSRQSLEVLVETQAMGDLVAAGARPIEPDRRVLSGALYALDEPEHALVNFDPEASSRTAPGMVVSAETMAVSVARGELEDPRSLKRPVRVVVPRALPTADVLLTRGRAARGGARGKGLVDKSLDGADPPGSQQFSSQAPRLPWTDNSVLVIRRVGALEGQPSVIVARALEDVQWVVDECTRLPELRALVAEHIPAAAASILSERGVLALQMSPDRLKDLAAADSMEVVLPEPGSEGLVLRAAGHCDWPVNWLAAASERLWLQRE